MNKLPPELAQNVKRLKFEYLTPIQRMVMPYIQVGKDIVCIAETGSGKTISYLFPIIGQMLITGVPENPFISNNKEEDKKESNENNEKEKEENANSTENKENESNDLIQKNNQLINNNDELEQKNKELNEINIKIKNELDESILEKKKFEEKINSLNKEINELKNKKEENNKLNDEDMKEI